MSQREFNNASFNQYLNEKKLAAARCPKCKVLFLPPRQICPECQGEQMEWVELKGKGKLAAFTCVSVGTTPTVQEGFDRNNPYCCGVVELEEGPKISARILGVDARKPESIKVGSACNVEFIERGECESKYSILAFRVN